MEDGDPVELGLVTLVHGEYITPSTRLCHLFQLATGSHYTDQQQLALSKPCYSLIKRIRRVKK